MNMIPFRCTHCGAKMEWLPPGARLAHCTSLGCGAVFLVQDGLAFGKVDDAAAGRVAECREAVKRLLRAGDYAGAAQAAREIVRILPEGGDFLARFYSLYALTRAGGDARPYEEFLEKWHDAAPGDLDEAALCALSDMETREEKCLEAFFEKNFEEPLKGAYLEKLARRTREAEAEAEAYALFPRDVFLCYRAKTQGELAKTVCARIEQEGYTVWYAQRNLPPHAREYWDCVRYAIEHCRVFLVLSSRDAMLSENVQREMRAAQACARPRVEWKLDESEHNSTFKYFFDGIQWVEGFGQTRLELEHLILRLNEELEQRPQTRGALPKETGVLPENALADGAQTPAASEDARRCREEAVAGDVSAQYNLGWMYAHGHGVLRDYEMAAQWYQKAARGKHAYAQFNLGVLYARGMGVPKSDEMAVKCFLEAAKQQDEDAQYRMGVACECGRGVREDAAQAAKWYLAAARRGLAEAQDAIGVMYEKGQGVARDAAQAANWFRKAAQQGCANSQYNLGVLYQAGRGVAQSDETAAVWFLRAAQKDHAAAAYNLALLYAQGRGVPQSPREALRWYREAARQGHRNAQYNLALMLMDGQETPKNDAEAVRLLTQLAQSGDADARRILCEKYHIEPSA